AAFIQWLIDPEPGPDARFQAYWQQERRSAAQISDTARLDRLYAQRDERRQAALPLLAANHAQSIFYQLDLSALATDYARSNHPLPAEPAQDEGEPLHLIHDRMFRAMVLRHRDQPDWSRYDAEAFGLLRKTLTAQIEPVQAHRNVLADQIVWARSPVRLDLAGGWTDTPPYCLLHGGRVVNLAAELNGQPPIQVYAKPLERPEIVIRSIDLSYEERLTTFEDLANYDQIGSAFAIPKAALALAGLLPAFARQPETSLARQLEAAGGGIELSLLAAVPKGSGLGTSSILAATVLGALSSYYELGWDLMEIGHRTLILEQLLTSGGGWQDQYGGILPGIKYLETVPGMDQRPQVRWLPDQFFRHPDQQACMLLYYTGITRVAHNILGEIVRGMFLNSSQHLSHIHQLYHHAQQTYEVIQRGQYRQLASMVRRTWELNRALDNGTNPPAVAAILAQVEDWLAGAKLLGAGGGGFLLMMAKDAQAAARVRESLCQNPPNALARFVEFAISDTGLQVTRS
ncbi:MAG: bifunctional fucokinase/L-fucose-1-P-guanylyltransferase, partial [Bacteroidetes bacterium]